VAGARADFAGLQIVLVLRDLAELGAAQDDRDERPGACSA